jgi:hypothetical protein
MSLYYIQVYSTIVLHMILTAESHSRVPVYQLFIYSLYHFIIKYLIKAYQSIYLPVGTVPDDPFFLCHS